MYKSNMMYETVYKSLSLKHAIIFVFIIMTVLQSTPVLAYNIIDSEQENDKSTIRVINGLIDINDNVEDDSSMDEAGKILTNQLGLNRINEDRRKKGLSEFSSKDVCKFGDEIVKKDTGSTPSIKAGISFASKYEEITMDSLPSSVDNSQLQAFPPIGDQGQLNSCVSYSTTYYQMTHMFGLALGWDVKNDTENIRKFSPQWTFNLTNAGENCVYGLDSTFLLFSKCGAALWNEFPYYSMDSSQQNYMRWPTDASVWRNALNYRIEDFGYVRIWDGSQTPVKDPHDPDLNKVKQLLNNGYVLTFETNISKWRFSQISDDKSINEDDAFIGENIAHMTDIATVKVDGHAMTLVGYNDNIWVDINKNGYVEEGEKGAFKIANSWGTSEELISSDGNFSWYSNEGFIWLSYDALNSVSSVPDCPISERRNAINGGNKAYWISPKQVSTPKLLIEYTLNHANKYEIETLFGYSNYNKKSPDSFIDPYNINLLTSSPSIKSSFDGTSYACDATLVFDISELYDRYDSKKGNLYITVRDKIEGNPCTLKDIKIIDNVSGHTYNYGGKLPVSFDNTSITIGPFNFKKEVSSLKGFKLSSSDMQTKRNYPAVASADNMVYVIGGIDDIGNFLNTVEVYNPETDTWTKKGDMNGEQFDVPYAVSVNNRIFAIRKLSDGEGVIEEYNSDCDKWKVKSQISYWESMDVIQTNEKIYIVGANDIYSNEDVVFKIDEYDTSTNTVSEETYMEKGWIPISTAALDGKIYVFGCRRYNPQIALQVGDSPYEYDMRLRVYDTQNNSWDVGEEVDFNASRGIVELNGKFYGLYYDLSENAVRICEYDTARNITTFLSGNCMNRSNFGLCSYKDSIILVGGKANTSATEIDSITDIVEIITIDPKKIPPVLEPPENLILAATGPRTATDLGLVDTIGNSDVIVTNNAPEAFPIGTTYVLWRAEDSEGNITKAIQEVTVVIDMNEPDLIVPSDIVVGTNADKKYVNIGTATVRNEVEVTIINDAPQIFPIGKTIVNWTAVDNFGRMTCELQTVNVYKYGDVDGNGVVNTIDFAFLRIYLLGLVSKIPGELGKYAADVDGSSDITSVDFALMRQYLLGYINKFPIGD
ncbi:dockerin type I domain-containing protein [Acetivibrio cellulolyticus]|uniref:dockerin type I domain-containing protein n=1 Tax=Acetivibrio cellulolyticus TaxID=35830 RepID=UPI0001E2D489|nr:dockerin type I domain-containing protein [Acetivibrio cellulolyticus]